MANDEYGDKTELPTEHRRQEARQKGNVARSHDLSVAGMTLVSAFALLLLGPGLMESQAGLLRSSLKSSAWLSLDRPFALQIFRDVLQKMGDALLPWLMLMALAAIAINLAQVGFLLTTESLAPKLSRLNPIEGAKRIFSIQGLVKLAVSLGKLAALCLVATLSISAFLPETFSLFDADPQKILLFLRTSGVKLAFQLAGDLIVLALADYGFQRWKYEQDLKMTKQELRDEMKTMEGDPQIRMRRREAHRKLAQARQLNAVAEADMVLVNPVHIAIAIKYDPDRMAAPQVVAKGKGDIAERIRDIASQHHIPIIERTELARHLYRTVKVGQSIPADMYAVFVELMAYVYRLTGRTPTSLKQ